MRVILSGGGTGGHVNPAIAIANTIAQHDPTAEITFVGTSRGIENKLVPAAGYPLEHIEIQGLRRKITAENFKTAYYVMTSVPKAVRLIRRLKPDLVIGTGGYACWPVVQAAADLGICTALHESNAIPGVAVKLLEHHIDRIYVNFNETIPHLRHPEKALRVGNPLKNGFSTMTREEAWDKLGITGKYEKMILSCGGSLGAEPINDGVLELMEKFTSKHPEILHLHATGSLEHEAATAKFHEMGLDKYENLKFIEYIYDMPLQMTAADVVINRAGAMTLSELAMERKCSVLIPSPYVTDNHQYKNASALANVGAAVLIEEKNLCGTIYLEDAVRRLLYDEEKIKSVKNAISAFAIPDCGDRIYSDLVSLVASKSNK